MRTVKNYIVVSAANQTQLVNKVREYIRDGWQPLGGMTDGYSQTMVEYEEMDLVILIREAIWQAKYHDNISS